VVTDVHRGATVGAHRSRRKWRRTTGSLAALEALAGKPRRVQDGPTEPTVTEIRSPLPASRRMPNRIGRSAGGNSIGSFHFRIYEVCALADASSPPATTVAVVFLGGPQGPVGRPPGIGAAACAARQGPLKRRNEEEVAAINPGITSFGSIKYLPQAEGASMIRRRVRQWAWPATKAVTLELASPWWTGSDRLGLAWPFPGIPFRAQVSPSGGLLDDALAPDPPSWDGRGSRQFCSRSTLYRARRAAEGGGGRAEERPVEGAPA